ncbi:MAG: hypothetical protein M0T73_07905 [Deltaproteobacteria bacterium]|nr:hypothetical protein [Deltaproteobacteria bacterium]
MQFFSQGLLGSQGYYWTPIGASPLELAVIIPTAFNLSGVLSRLIRGYMLHRSAGNFSPGFGHPGYCCLISSVLIWLVRTTNAQ